MAKALAEVVGVPCRQASAARPSPRAASPWASVRRSSWLMPSPLILLHGLVAGFVGPGPALGAVGLIWVAVFLWFWSAGLVQAGREARA